jgi:hypothetical protein
MNRLPTTLDIEQLNLSRNAIEAGKIPRGWKELQKEADEKLSDPLYSVMDKELLPASGDKHDYLSLGAYWWPDPFKPDGLPYIQKDGQFYPPSRTNQVDSIRLKDFCHAINCYSLAYYLSGGDKRYGTRVVRLLDHFFLNPQSKMNPHLKYAQAIKGVCDGRGIGIIDAAHLYMVVDGIQICSDLLSESQAKGLREWFEQFLDWLLTSSHGKEEKVHHNNHGTFYAATVACIALYLDKPDIVRDLLIYETQTRLSNHFEANGSQPKELERTRCFHYSVYNLMAHYRLARYGELTGVDIWNLKTDTGEPYMKAGIGFLLPYIVEPENWPYKDITGVEVLSYISDGILGLLLQYHRIFGSSDELERAIEVAKIKLGDKRDWLVEGYTL